MNANLEGVDTEPRVIGPVSVFDAKTPGVPRAADDSFFIEVAGAERRAHVRAEVIDGEVAAIVEKDGDEAFTDLERTALALGNVSFSGYGHEFIRVGVGRQSFTIAC